MTKSTRDMLHENMSNVRDTLCDVMQAIDDGLTYFPDGQPWPEDVWADPDGDLATEDGEAWPSAASPANVRDFEEGRDAADFLADYPLEVIDERGRNFAVVLATGGPHIEIEADGQGDAVLRGYWGGEQVTLHGDVFNRVLDWFIDRD